MKPAIQLCLVARKKSKIDQIPDDILSEVIFKKLPLTSLCTCKCVSKLWSSLIIQNYHQSQQRLPIICRITLSTNPLRLCSIDSNTGAVTPLYSPIDLGPNTLMGPMCSNGFICYKDTMDYHKFVVFNPATQEKIIVHNPNEYFNHHFGYDPCSNKFKLFGWRNYPDCEVYTLGTDDSWRKVTSRPVQGSGKKCSMFYCFNGIIYWYSDTGMINLFHLSTESFSLIQGPNSEPPVKRIPYMFDLEGCLGLAVLPCKSDKMLDLWMLKDRYTVNSGWVGWVLIASINKPLGKEIVWIMCPYLIRTGELLLAQCEEQGSQSFYFYSLLTRQFQNIKICGQASYYLLENFRENLGSLKDF